MSTMTITPCPDRLRIPLTARGLILASCVLFATAVACADEATGRLLNLVGVDVGLCVEIPRLDALATRGRPPAGPGVLLERPRPPQKEKR